MVNNSTSLLFLALYHKGTCVHHQQKLRSLQKALKKASHTAAIPKRVSPTIIFSVNASSMKKGHATAS
jgi:hypothetical protein